LNKSVLRELCLGSLLSVMRYRSSYLTSIAVPVINMKENQNYKFMFGNSCNIPWHSISELAKNPFPSGCHECHNSLTRVEIPPLSLRTGWRRTGWRRCCARGFPVFLPLCHLIIPHSSRFTLTPAFLPPRHPSFQSFHPDSCRLAFMLPRHHSFNPNSCLHATSSSFLPPDACRFIP
jgi:hypothetical protein